MKTPLSFHYSTLCNKSQWFCAKMAQMLRGNGARFASRAILVVLTLVSLLRIPVSSAVAIGGDVDGELLSKTTAESLRTYRRNTNSFRFTDYTVDYYLEKSESGTSKMRVREEFVAVFPESDVNHGFKRMIPFTNQDGKNLTTKSDQKLDIKVTRNGADEPHEVTVENDAFIVTIGDADFYVHGKQTYVLEYEFVNVITDFNDYQELYWDTNGTSSQQRFDEVVARVHFGDDVSEKYENKSWCYVGKYGENGDDRCDIQQINDGVEFTTENLIAGENLTIDLQFQPGSFVVPEPKWNYLGLLLVTGEVVLSGIMIWLVLRAKAKIQDKYRFYKEYFIKPEYTAPHEVTVAEADANYPASLSGKTNVATLLELAVNHKIEIIDATPEGKRSKKWRIQINTLELEPNQRKTLEIIAGSRRLEVGQKIDIKRRSNTSLLTRLQAELIEGIQNSLKAKGYTIADSKGKTTRSDIVLILGIVGGIGCFVLNMIIMQELGNRTWKPLYGGNIPSIIGCVLAFGIFVGGFASTVWLRKYESHTKKGLELARYLDGLKLYIKMAEEERLQVLQSVEGADTSHQGVVKLYEKLLPYAVIFGLEKSWLKELGKYYEYNDVARPDWYVTMGAFTAANFISDLNSISTTSARSFYGSTGTSSSGFSGGGGGGFSGGGGGGGGTSGW